MSGLAAGSPYTVRDLVDMPDDGRRRELIDGTLLVTPAPGWAHQEMCLTLYTALRAACPPELRVLAAPFAVRTSAHDEVQPDVLVARFADLAETGLTVAPLLVAEIASPSTALHDRNTKRAHYERLGVPSHWVLDPSAPASMDVLELDDSGRYASVATAAGDDGITVTRPFGLTLSPARLLDGLHRS